MICGEVIKCDICHKKVIRKLNPLSDAYEWSDVCNENDTLPFREVKTAVVRGGKNLTLEFSNPIGLTLCEECYDKIFSRYPIGYDEDIRSFYLRLDAEE